MDISGELSNSHILVKKSSDIGRLYNKSHIGTLVSGNVLQLDLLEGVFLLDEGKMMLFQNKKSIKFPQLLMLAAQQVPEFEPACRQKPGTISWVTGLPWSPNSCN